MLGPRVREIRKDAGEPSMKTARHRSEIIDACAGQSTKEDAGGIIRCSADEVDVEVPVDVGAVAWQQACHKAGIEGFGCDHIGVEWDHPSLEPSNQVAG